MPRKTKHVALVLSLNKRFDRKVIEGVTRFVHESGLWSVFLEDDPSAKIPNFQRGHFDGVIADLDDVRIPREIVDLNIPVVGIGGVDPTCHTFKVPISTVGTNNFKIAEIAAEYLMGLGLRQFGYCGLPTHTIDPWNHERQKTFVEQVVTCGHKCAVFSHRYSPSRSWEQLQEALYVWLARLPKPVGVLTANDVRARHVLEACRRFKLSVPDDVAVLGVDNDDLICQLATPPLSSIAQNTEEIGYRAARTLNHLMCHPNKNATHQIIDPVTVVERASTDLVATEDYVVAKALRYIRENACSGLSVEKVACAIGVSRSTLDGHFKTKLSRTAHNEIQRVQLNQVRNLLTTTELTLEEIASRSGFCHAQYLAVLFKKICKQTPGEYRRRVR